MLQVHQQRFEPLPLPHLAAPLPEESHIAESAARGPFGLIAPHALLHQLIDLLVDVLLDGDRDVVVAAIPEEEAAEPWHSTPLMFWLRQAHG